MRPTLDWNYGSAARISAFDCQAGTGRHSAEAPPERHISDGEPCAEVEPAAFDEQESLEQSALEGSALEQSAAPEQNFALEESAADEQESVLAESAVAEQNSALAVTQQQSALGKGEVDEHGFFADGDAGLYPGGPATLVPVAFDEPVQVAAPRRERSPEELARHHRFVRLVAATVGALIAMLAVGVARTKLGINRPAVSEPAAAPAQPAMAPERAAPARHVSELAKSAAPNPVEQAKTAAPAAGAPAPVPPRREHSSAAAVRNALPKAARASGHSVSRHARRAAPRASGHGLLTATAREATPHSRRATAARSAMPRSGVPTAAFPAAP